MILLVTHTLIWLDEANDRLGKNARALIDHSLQSGELFVSVVSFWEVAMLVEKGRLEIEGKVTEWRKTLIEHGLKELPLLGEVAIKSAGLEGFHGDPADRMIVASAMHSGAALCTADEKILSWEHEIVYVDARK